MKAGAFDSEFDEEVAREVWNKFLVGQMRSGAGKSYTQTLTIYSYLTEVMSEKAKRLPRVDRSS